MGKTTNETNGNPSKKLGKVTKAKKGDAITARMVIAALNHLDTNLKKSELGTGHSLAKIRYYMRDHHGIEMTKNRQELVKYIIRLEIDQGNIEMTNHNGPVNFSKRFQATVMDDEINDEASTATPTDTEEDEE